EFWIREAIEGLNPGRPRDLEIALERVYPVLGKIADPAVREAYRVKAADLLGIEARLMTRPVKASRKPPERESNGDEAPARSRPALGARASVGQHLLSVLAVRPEALERLRSQVGPETFAEDDRRTYHRMLETFSGGGLAELQSRLESFDEHEQELIRRAWASPPPRVDDEYVDDLASRLRLEAAQTELRSVNRKLSEAEQRGDRDQ